MNKGVLKPLYPLIKILTLGATNVHEKDILSEIHHPSGKKFFSPEGES